MTNIDYSKPIPFVNYGDGKSGVDTIIDSYEAAPEELSRMWYQKICSEEELQRILHVSNANDYILRTAVDTISANSRLYRVIRAHRIALGDKWSLEGFMSSITYGYDNIKHHLTPENKALVDAIGTGCILSNDMNGIIFDSPYGLCSTLSYSLIYFVQFASLTFCDFGIPVPDSVRGQAIRIATRINLGRESLDFDLDPRGIIPDTINQQTRSIFNYICTFIAGHEYGHYMNGDVTHNAELETDIIDRTLHLNKTDSWKSMVYYSCHAKELNADLTALNLPILSDDEYAKYYFCTLLWFSMLSVVEAAEETIFPSMGTPSHPSAKIRYRNILDNAKRPCDYMKNEKLYTKDLPSAIEKLSHDIIDDVSYNFDYYEFYGSTYLAHPNTEWRGRELIDRVDY